MPIRFERPVYFKLVDRRPVPVDDAVEWSTWFAQADRRVAETWIDDVRISTVFLGLDHNFLDDQDPALFETVAFVGGAANKTRRYFIWEEAEAGHADVVSQIRNEMETTRISAVDAWATLVRRWSLAPDADKA